MFLLTGTYLEAVTSLSIPLLLGQFIAGVVFHESHYCKDLHHLSSDTSAFQPFVCPLDSALEPLS